MMTAISEEKRWGIEPQVTEVAIRLAALEKIAVRNDKIRIEKKRVMRKNVNVAARKMIEWKVE